MHIISCQRAGKIGIEFRHKYFYWAVHISVHSVYNLPDTNSLYTGEDVLGHPIYVFGEGVVPPISDVLV